MKKRAIGLLLAVLVIFSTALVVGEPEDTGATRGGPQRDFTHTVLAEEGTATWCGYCPAVAGYLHYLYDTVGMQFYYIALIGDVNTHAAARNSELGLSAYPTVFFDGGYQTIVGDQGSSTPYQNAINTCGNRTVADIGLNLSVTWMGSATMDIAISASNNEASTYSGHLHAYVVENVSRWNMADGNPYHFGFLDYAFNGDISIGAGGTYTDSTIWDGANHTDGYGNNFGDITQDNTMVIAAVFDTSTDYVDETTAAMPSNATDTTPPEIADLAATPSSQDMYGYVNLTANVTDNAGVDVVKAVVNYPDGSSVNQTMSQVGSTDTYYYNTTYDLPGSYLFQVWAQDVNGNTNTSCCPCYFNVNDIVPPQIANVTAEPASQYASERVNITAHVTDNVGISTVAANVTAPGGGHTNATMTRISGTDTYYYNATYFTPGTYSFSIWCDDWEGNMNVSGPHSFTILDATVDLSFSPGWNLMTVPVANDYNASSLGQAIPGCSIVAYWNASSGMFQSYVVGVSPGSGFAIQDGVGYFVYVNASGTFSVTGAPLSDVTVDLYTGWNTIGWFDANATSASSLAPAVPQCNIAAYWNTSSSTFQSYTVGVTPPPGFTITQGMGVFVYVTTPGVWNGQG